MSKFQKISIVVMVLAITIFYFFANPNHTNFLPCLFHKITGFHCFGCGGQRAFHALLHGEFKEAFRDNLLIFIVLPIVGVKLFNEIFEKKYFKKYANERFFVSAIITIFIVFGILRNLPFEPFTAMIP